ncbi:GRIP1-associated protein 1 isoform X2 [Hemicordylus capensis]|uniref:GRIP1-associated protein 1 isoform X2 n=1 Tax=Hemicordylus capensis TaxID=884348 RepID=UPI002304BFF7|nr:GRIP1-associated protein 1 isoform X2 [Hemicordylus capensis]
MGEVGAYSLEASAFGIHSCGAGDQETVINGTPGSQEFSGPRSPVREYSREFLSSRHPPRSESLSPQRSTHSKDGGINVTNGMEYNGQHSSSRVPRRHSLAHLQNGDSGAGSQTPARRGWSGSELDLRASLPGTVQWEDALGTLLRDTGTTTGGCSAEIQKRNLELELDMMEFELLSLKQKMESSFAHLEKEKKWLETTRSEGRKHKGALDEKISHVGMELEKARSYFRERNHGTPSLGPSQNAAMMRKKDADQELIILQASLVALKTSLKTVEEERDTMAKQLNSAKEEKDRLSTKVVSLEEKVNELTLKLKPALSDTERLLQEKVALHQQVQHLTLDLECAQKKQEGFDDQVPALHSELVHAKTQVNHQDQEKVVMKEELESIRQINKELSSEVAESCQRLGVSLEKLHQLEAEKKITDNRVQALETERSQLLGERERPAVGRNQEEDIRALQKTCEHLREAQSLQQREKGSLQNRLLELERALQSKQEEMENQQAEQQRVSQYWQERWEQVTAALQSKEEELEKAHGRSQTLPAKGQQLTRSLDAKVVKSPQREKERLIQQHQLVTEQLKELFRQRQQQQQAGYRKWPRGPKEESPVEISKPQEILAVPESIGLPREGQPQSQDISSSSEEKQSLQQQLKEKTETISAMLSEIQALQQKNESLMKAKLRFQQQIQEIHQVPTQQPHKSTAELLVPRLAASTGQDLPGAQGSSSTGTSPQSDDPALSSCSREGLHLATQKPPCQPITGDERSSLSSDHRAMHLPLTKLTLLSAGPPIFQPDLSDPAEPSIILSLDSRASLAPESHTDSEGATLSPRGPALLSPRPFGLQRPRSPFKFKGSTESLED